MTDPLEERLRQAMDTAAGGFTPAAAPVATRSALAGRVRRRQRVVLSVGVAVALVVSGGTVALARIADRGSSSQQVAARGASRSGVGGTSAPEATGAGGTAPGTAAGGATPGTASGGDTATSKATSPAPPGTAGPPLSSPGAGVPPAPTTVPTSPPRPTTPPTSSATTPPAAGTSQIVGTVVFGPVCPVERFPPDPACAPRPGAAHIELVRPDGTVAAQGNAGSDGRFALTVAPGSYTVDAASLPPAPAVGRGCAATPALVTVAPGGVAQVSVSCDTGIR